MERIYKFSSSSSVLCASTLLIGKFHRAQTCSQIDDFVQVMDIAFHGDKCNPKFWNSAQMEKPKV